MFCMYLKYYELPECTYYAIIYGQDSIDNKLDFQFIISDYRIRYFFGPIEFISYFRSENDRVS